MVVVALLILAGSQSGKVDENEHLSKFLAHKYISQSFFESISIYLQNYPTVCHDNNIKNKNIKNNNNNNNNYNSSNTNDNNNNYYYYYLLLLFSLLLFF